jgi:hypothetical protein
LNLHSIDIRHYERLRYGSWTLIHGNFLHID